MIIKNYCVKSDLELNLIHFTPEANIDAPIIIFIHPTGFVSNMYATVAAHLRGMNIFGLDLRSHGASEKGNVSDWAFLGNDLFSVFESLKEKTGQKKFYGVGISSGSSALALHASKHSADFHGLYLCEPIVFPPGTDLATREYLANSAKNRRDTFESSEVVYERFSSRGALSALSQSSIALYAKYGFKEIGNQITLRCEKEDEETIYLTGSENNVWENLPNINVKTIIAYGEISNTMNFELAKKIAEQIPNSTLEMLPGVGHFTLFENPTLGARAIEGFIRQAP